MLFEVLHLEILARMDNLLSFLSFLLILSGTAFKENGKILFLKNARVWVVSERFWWERWSLEHRCCASCREQPSVLQNVYRLHYSFFKGKGQNILHVSFHTFHYSFQCCVTKFCGYFLSRVSLFCLFLCRPDKQWPYAIGRERIEDGKPCVTSVAIILFEKDFS